MLTSKISNIFMSILKMYGPEIEPWITPEDATKVLDIYSWRTEFDLTSNY